MSPATSTTRKRPARAAATTAPPEPDTTSEQQEEVGDDLIVIPVGKPAHTPDVERLPVFRYGNTTFTMPSLITFQQAARVLWTMREHDRISGGMEAIRALCGQQAVDVLLNAPEITDEHILRVVSKVTNHLFGIAAKQETGKDSTGE